MNQGPSGPVLADGPVTDLWTLSERLVPELAERAGGETAALTPDERARHARQRSPGARRRFLGGRLLCRLALSARTGLPPGVWRFTEGVHGRPELAPGHHGLRFNVSHTDGLIACVVTEGYASGVDVERVPFDDETVRLLTTQFDEAQRAALAEAPDPAAALQEMWVLSEAYLKGLGIGLVQGLGELRFTRCPGSTGVTVADGRRPETCRRWRLDLTGHGSGHLLAVAVDDGGAGRLRRHDLAEPGDLDRPDVPPGPWHAAGRPAAPASP
ncbi:4'-phosphopantetheinyl transferase family protein [Streptomyces sp. NPDC056524]|uniref:4'-phosphopantetheinyl transferase family protein n=1 Tax=Streptomyces sp. NPDC056524 TaxID=3345851 RepID=UPI0036A82D3B